MPETKSDSPPITPGPVERPTVSAVAALGLDEAPSKTLATVAESARKQQPSDTGLTDDDGLPASPTPTPTPTPDEKPAVTEPEKPAATETPKPEVTAPPAKIKVGDKEYTPEELQAAFAERERLQKELEDAKKAPPVPTPAPTPKPEPEKPKELTPEEIIALENDWTEKAVKAFKFEPNANELEAILGGGEEGVAALKSYSARLAARTMLETNKKLYADLNPVIQELRGQIAPLLEQSVQLQRVTIEQEFLRQHPDFSTHVDTARSVAEELSARYGDRFVEGGRFNQAAFIAEVARQTDRILQAEFKRWNPSAPGTWRDALKKPAAAAAAAPVTAPAVPPTTPAAPAQPAPPAPPAANTPSGQAAPVKENWHKSTAKSLTH